MSQTSAILGLLTETSLHAGTGQMVGVIDLPIQRESHTGWPCVYGSAVKGAMRTLAEDRVRAEKTENHKNGEPNGKNHWVEEVFGPEMTSASEYAGALAVGDARLLLLPVRSLTSHFKWVTCPALLRRLQADYRRLQLTTQFPEIPIPPDKDTALVATEHDTDLGLFLEEFRFIPQTSELLNNVIKMIAPLMGRNDAVAALTKQLTLVDDDLFSHLACYTTPVNAHIAIDNKTKIVKPGALWYEETLPPDTLLYVALIAQSARKTGSDKSAKKVIEHIQELFDENHPYLQLGGNETVGMGWCKVIVKSDHQENAVLPHPVSTQQKPSTATNSQPVKGKTKFKSKIKNMAANDETTTESYFQKWATDYYGEARWGRL